MGAFAVLDADFLGADFFSEDFPAALLMCRCVGFPKKSQALSNVRQTGWPLCSQAEGAPG
jgi:hypothetical protein